MTAVMRKKPTYWRPAGRHKNSQNARVLYELVDEAIAAVDEVIAVVDALMRISLRTELLNNAAIPSCVRGQVYWTMVSPIRWYRSRLVDSSKVTASPQAGARGSWPWSPDPAASRPSSCA